MRVRATRGLRITNFYGNYFIRGTDLLALPNCTPDSVFAVEFGYDEQLLTASVITVQVRMSAGGFGGGQSSRGVRGSVTEGGVGWGGGWHQDEERKYSRLRLVSLPLLVAHGDACALASCRDSIILK